ncbi:glutathione S-transferase family protein [Pseudomarimonas arenosa]|uniref:Glutathione S-transferase family protein n=1 Tax=Pseudomarimonas arenosa TaxID=2774145 RepID=A0AAW3ZJ67_9GAMM|nr:glutathione S-transferase family protein [Pseudomarimonas arenosa]
MPSKLVLYSFVPFDRSARVRWLAHELGIEIEEHKLDYAGGEHRGEDHLRRHPFGLVPAIEMNGESQWESVAICQALAEQHPEAGFTVPLASPMRKQYLSWLMFAASTFDAAAFAVFNSSAIKPSEDRRKHGMAELFPLLVHLARHLNERDFLMGERFMLPDLIIGHSIQLLYLVKALEDYPGLRDYRRRLAERPAAKAASVFSPRPQ